MDPKSAGGSPARAFGADWQRWQRLNQLPASALPIPAALNTDKQLVSGSGILSGFALREVSGGAITIQIFDGSDATGLLLTENLFLANSNAQIAIPTGLYFEAGLWIHFLVATGGIRGSVFAKLASELGHYAELS